MRTDCSPNRLGRQHRFVTKEDARRLSWHFPICRRHFVFLLPLFYCFRWTSMDFASHLICIHLCLNSVKLAIDSITMLLNIIWWNSILVECSNIICTIEFITFYKLLINIIYLNYHLNGMDKECTSIWALYISIWVTSLKSIFNLKFSFYIM